jgi:hypothetical protein
MEVVMTSVQSFRIESPLVEVVMPYKVPELSLLSPFRKIKTFCLDSKVGSLIFALSPYCSPRYIYIFFSFFLNF